jgi:undecaprenyl diphosphate synthase
VSTPLHVAVIMDGNGRWALGRGLPRAAGHAEGARAVRRTVEAAARLGVGTLTLYAFSADNWRRPSTEVASLMRLFRRYLASETARCVDANIRLCIVGRRDRLPRALRSAIEGAEAATAGCGGMRLRIALGYSSRDAIVKAAELLRDDADAGARGREPLTRERFAAAIGAADNQQEPAPDVDLVIRTGGERRLSDFLLWECAYAELHFSPRYWPDFGDADLAAALRDFASRDRRFGAVTPAVAG